MALSNLSTHEMLGLSGAWLDPKRAQKALNNNPRTSHLLPDLQAVHEALLQEKPSSEPSKELAALLAEQADKDAVHDSKARGVNLVLAGMALLASSEEQQAVAAANSALFPEGLGFINTSYTAEAGNTEATELRLGKASEAEALLKKTKLPWGTTLRDEIQAWFDAGHALGKLEAKRQHLEPVVVAATNPRSRARNRWLTLVATMRDNILIDATIPEAMEREVLKPLREIEALADARTARKKKAAEDSSEGGNGNPAG